MRASEISILHISIFSMSVSMSSWFSNVGGGGWETQKSQKEKRNFFFTESFRCFRLNKSVLETKETKQADSQLYFAPKNIKIYLVVFENEFFEVEQLVSKKLLKLKHAYMVVCIRLSVKGTYIEHIVNTRVNYVFSFLVRF